MLVGAAGSGKSSALARLAQELQAEIDEARRGDLLVIPHFVGASPRSTSLRETLVRVLGILQTAYGDAIDFDASAELRDLIGAFRDALERVPEDEHLVLVLDAVNQFDARDRAERLTWLRTTLPPNVRVVLSTIRSEVQVTEAALMAERWGYRLVEVLPLTDEERRRIAREVPAIAAKTLDDWQLDLLLSNPATRNPLFLRVALEELRGFGSFEDLNDRIRRFPKPDEVDDPVAAIFMQVAERLEEDFDLALVREVLRLLASARRGLTEAEMRNLVAEQDEADELFPVLRQLRPYLMRRGEVIDFFHQALWKAVRARYLSDETEHQAAHERLVDYFAKQPDFVVDGPPGECQPNARKTDELPHQLLAADQAERLAEVLMGLSFLEAKAEAGQITDLADDFAACRERVGEEMAYLLRVLEQAIRHDTGFLLRHPESLFQQLWNRAWWYDAPEAARHFDVPEDAPASYVPPWAREGPRAHRLVERWREERKAQPWVRFVRPTADLYSGDVTVLRGHERAVNYIAFSPDGSRLASASKDQTVRLWSVETGEELAVLRGHEGSVDHVAFSPDGSCLASACVSAYDSVRLWSVETGEELAVLRGHRFSASYVAFSPDGSRLASASKDQTVRLWSVETGEELAVLRGHEHSVIHVAFSPDGSRLASASRDVRLWSVETGEELAVLRGRRFSARYVAFSPDGTRLMSSSADGTVRLWSVERGKELGVLRGHEGVISSIALSPDGTRLASSSDDGTVRLWSLQSDRELVVPRGHKDSVSPASIRHHVAFSPDGSRLASVSKDKTVRLWSVETGEELAVLRGHEGSVDHVAFSPDGSRLASASKDKTVRLWSVETGEELAVLRGHKIYVNHVVFSPDGIRLASGSRVGAVRMWSVETGEELAVLRGHRGWINYLAFSPSGSRLASASRDQTVRLWSVERGEELAVLRGHEGSVDHVAFSPDGSRLASGSLDDTVRLWSVETAKELERVETTNFVGAGLGYFELSSKGVAPWVLVCAGVDWMVRPIRTEANVTWISHNFRGVIPHPLGETVWAAVSGSAFYLFRLEDADQYEKALQWVTDLNGNS